MASRYHVAVRRVDDDAILVDAHGAMPGFHLDAAPPWQVVMPVVDRLLQEHGLHVVALRAAWLGGPAAGDGGDRLYEAAYAGGPIPPGARWVRPDDLERRPTPLGRAIDAGALEPAAGDRQPWYRPDWYPQMCGWVDERLGDHGIRRRGPIRQVRSWGRSALLTLETDRGRLWAKQVPSVFIHEVVVTGLLEDMDPGIVPPLVAVDASSGRLLMEHVDGPLLSSQTRPEAWLATMARLAEIQRVLAADLQVLRMAGVPSAPLARLADRIPSLLSDERLLLRGRPGGLTAAEHARLQGATPDLVAACRALDVSDIGPSLEHGDLSAGQVIMGEMGPVFLDWSDATITHPFLAAAAFLIDPVGLPADLEPDLERAYLDGWAGSASAPGAAASALLLARVVHPLHMAQLYADRILPGLEQPWEMDRVVPLFLRALLPRLATLPGILAP